MAMTAQDLVTEAKSQVPPLSVTEFLTIQGQKEPFYLIDVREADEWNAGHINGAIHIARGLLEFTIAEIVPNKHAPIIVQCASGGRSALCAQMLLKMGYTNVKNFEGGYTAYVDAMKNKQS